MKAAAGRFCQWLRKNEETTKIQMNPGVLNNECLFILEEQSITMHNCSELPTNLFDMSLFHVSIEILHFQAQLLGEM